ncbi:hypothetical protein BKA61DRAFT_696904 [Leptodontidium sp. MPI-SDFR-AT-0119]|nr:hypothetical protein BKA61DRAFT_696904 [Leptodontidium sp. MPI-SDFR-AT-0119]
MNEELGAAASGLPPETSGTIQRIESNGSKKAKKVRSACERCRHRRIKVFSRLEAGASADTSVVRWSSPCMWKLLQSWHIMRYYALIFSAANANARIAWLEDIIRTQLPHINIDDGPFFTATTYSDVPAALSIEPRSMPPKQSPLLSRPRRPLSNLYRSAIRETSVEQDTRSVALDLGLLSLNPESRQVHYLGSSSGSLFASLLETKNIGGSLFGNSRRDDPSAEFHGGNDGDNRIDMSQLEDVRKAVQSLYEQLRKDLPSRSDCDVLLRRFFQYAHPNHPFLHRPSFD